MATAVKKNTTAAQKKLDVKYDTIHKQLMDYLLSGDIHSTLVGKTISMDHSDNSIDEVEEYVEYVVRQLRAAEQYSARKDNVN